MKRVLKDEISRELANIVFNTDRISSIRRIGGITTVQWKTEEQQGSGTYLDEEDITDNALTGRLKQVCHERMIGICSGTNRLGWYATLDGAAGSKWSGDSEYIAVLHAIESLVEKGKMGNNRQEENTDTEPEINIKARAIISRMCVTSSDEFERRLVERIARLEQFASVAGGSIVSRQIIAAELVAMMDREAND